MGYASGGSPSIAALRDGQIADRRYRGESL
jgi:hypothetical protein